MLKPAERHDGSPEGCDKTRLFLLQCFRFVVFHIYSFIYIFIYKVILHLGHGHRNKVLASSSRTQARKRFRGSKVAAGDEGTMRMTHRPVQLLDMCREFCRCPDQNQNSVPADRTPAGPVSRTSTRTAVSFQSEFWILQRGVEAAAGSVVLVRLSYSLTPNRRH